MDFTCGPGYKFGSRAAPLVEGVFLRWVEPLNQDFRFGSSDGTSLHPTPSPGEAQSCLMQDEPKGSGSGHAGD